LVAAIAASLLAWQVVRTNAVDALIGENPYAAALVAPNDPAVKIALARTEFELQNGRVSPASQSAAEGALRRAPLASDPFLLVGVAAIAAGDRAKGERFLTEAQRRNPRSRIAHLLLLDAYLRNDRIEDAAAGIATLTRLLPQAGTVLVAELGRMVRDPRTGPGLINILGRDPAMQEAVLAHLATESADPDLILKIAAAGPRRAPSAQSAAWQMLLLDRLVEKGDIGRAYGLWRGFAGLGGASTDKAVYDGRFQGLPGEPPFNWRLAAGASGVAERTKRSELQVEYYGRDRAEMASQLLILQPGRYSMRFGAHGDAPGEGSKLTWTLACRAGDAQLFTMPVTNINSASRTFTREFTVPASGCSAQWLRLIGAPDDFPTAQSLTISDVRIEPGSGG